MPETVRNRTGERMPEAMPDRLPENAKMKRILSQLAMLAGAGA